MRKVQSNRGSTVCSWRLVLVASFLLAFVGPAESSVPPPRRVLARFAGETKGGVVSVALIGERHGENAVQFAQGERFKVLVTCPPSLRAQLRLFVFQGGTRYEPLAPKSMTCGNLVPWPGAFSIDGQHEAQICVAWGATPDATSAGALGEDAVCAQLKRQANPT